MSKFNFINKEVVFEHQTVDDNFELAPIRLKSFSSRGDNRIVSDIPRSEAGRINVSELKEVVRAELNELLTDNIFSVRMNSITFNRLRATYGYEIQTVSKKNKIRAVIGQIKKCLIIKDDSLENFVLVQVVKNIYKSQTNNKNKFMQK